MTPLQYDLMKLAEECGEVAHEAHWEEQFIGDMVDNFAEAKTHGIVCTISENQMAELVQIFTSLDEE